MEKPDNIDEFETNDNDDFIEIIDLEEAASDETAAFGVTDSSDEENRARSEHSGESAGPGESEEEIKQAEMYGTVFEEKSKEPYILKSILEILIVCVIAWIAATLIKNYVILVAEVPSRSMMPTIEKDSKLIGNKLAYLFTDPKRGDVIIFDYPDNEDELFIKRVIGIPGDTVAIADGDVYVNGAVITEEYLLDDNGEYPSGEPTGNYGPYVVPEGCYFVLGDNRNNSKDSRFWTNTFVSIDEVRAKAVLNITSWWEVIR